MSMELQGLIDRINAEGLERAESERAEIVRHAEAQAANIVAKARTDAENLLKNAQAEAAKLQQRAEAAVRQAARDILFGLRAELNVRLEKLVKNAADQAMTPEAMRQIILALIPATANVNGAALEIAVANTLPPEAVSKLVASLTADLKTAPVVQLRSDMEGGLKIGVKGSDLYADLSDEAITKLVCAYVGTQIAAILDAP